MLWVTAPVALRAEPCRSEPFKGASYIVCSFDLTKDAVRMYWTGDDGRPYRTFAALANDLKAKGKMLRFAMNGGMYQADLRPVGLYIENGHNYDRLRGEGEGRDWEGFETEDRDDWED